jgi:hypothetical protein
MSEIKGILDGVDKLIDGHIFNGDRFEGYSYKHKRSCALLSKAPPESFDGTVLISDIYACIEENLRLRPEDRTPSSANWMIRSGTASGIQPDPKNTSAEVTLERAIAQRWPEIWTYQMPIASGLFGPKSDKRRAIDLVCSHGNNCFDFVELKIRSNTPLHAAMEILCYGLVYLASRKDPAQNLQYGSGASIPLMSASAINLVVLAPPKFYEQYKLDWLERGLNDGLKELLTKQGMPKLVMKFCFERFADDFKWESTYKPDMLPEKLERKRVYS